MIFEGCDLLAGAQTGTGKTAAFARLSCRSWEKIPGDKRRRPQGTGSGADARTGRPGQ
ncbi:MAG: hypothetical protein R2864_06000 [Syntrophotaleaceae bacterium]